MADKAYQIAFNGTAVDNDFYGDVVLLTVEEGTAMPGTFHLQLTSRMQENGSWGYLDDDRLAVYTKVSIKIGFTGGGGLLGAIGSLLGGGSDGNDGLATVFDGYITAVDLNLGSAPSSTFVEVSGMDTGVLMSLEEKIASWENMADSDIVQQILGDYGVQVTADTTPTVHQDTDTTVLQRATDIQFVRDLARRNGLEFYFETDDKSGNITGYFRAPQLDGTPQADLAIQFADQSNLKSFSAHLSATRPLNVKTQQMDVKANSPNSGQVSDTVLTKLGDKDATSLIGGALGSLVTPKDAQAQMLVLGTPTSNATELTSIAQAVRDEAGWFIAAQGEVNSDAYQAVLRPRRLVLVKGAGKSFSGKYYVTKVVHEIKVDGSYTQKFEARRNARDVDGSEQFGGGSSGLSIPGM
jgi:phage protein D